MANTASGEVWAWHRIDWDLLRDDVTSADGIIPEHVFTSRDAAKEDAEARHREEWDEMQTFNTANEGAEEYPALVWTEGPNGNLEARQNQAFDEEYDGDVWRVERLLIIR